jgi:hypothetical protein
LRSFVAALGHNLEGLEQEVGSFARSDVSGQRSLLRVLSTCSYQ